MGTLRGGLGIMQNFSNADNPDHVTDSMVQLDYALGNTDGGAILNIKNVLNQIQKQHLPTHCKNQLEEYMCLNLSQNLADDMDE
jgi:hypothetical protein